ncbi:MAG: hypothetical protein HUU56_17860 [Bdellovibrionaceae bacterium]|nr:hypothetical protein [Pseudobdellovibrionaceae bacterium]
MLILKYFLILIFYVSVVMANEKNSDVSKKLLLLPDATYEVTKRLPSLLLTSPTDSRIDELAKEKKELFLVKIQNVEQNLVVIVDPNSSEGIFWWKKSSRLVLTIDRWTSLIKNETNLTESEISFFSKSDKFKF